MYISLGVQFVQRTGKHSGCTNVTVVTCEAGLDFPLDVRKHGVCVRARVCVRACVCVRVYCLMVMMTMMVIVYV